MCVLVKCVQLDGILLTFEISCFKNSSFKNSCLFMHPNLSKVFYFENIFSTKI